jgi:murein DD-endopeptidase MepM/ murein hydrolase activator NlpD
MQRLVLPLLVLITAGMILFFGSMIFLSAPVPEAQREAAAPLPPPQAPVIAPSGLAIPVAGVEAVRLSDTYTQARAGGARAHDAIDIMAPRGTPVVAAADGTVEKLFFSQGGGGITAYVRSADRQWSYYYAHLDAYAPGLREGQAVRRGDPIGTVGSTGNANPAGPHLHFAVNRMGPADRWWQGTPVNPYPLLAGAAPRR